MASSDLAINSATHVCTWRGRKSEQLNLRNPDSYRVLASPARSRGRIFLPSQLHLYVAHLMARSGQFV
jgi:hypothetical protein